MCLQLLLFLLCCRTWLLCSGGIAPSLPPSIDTWESDLNYDTGTRNSTSVMTTNSGDQSDNKTIIEPAKCQTDKDCEELHIEAATGSKIICEIYLGICIIGIVEDPNETESPNESTFDPKRTTTKLNNSTLVVSKSTTPLPLDNNIEPANEFNSIPIVVWILFTIPFISIIVIGIICGRRLKKQSENIQENLLRTTINGVHVDQLLSQRELMSSIAFSRPPPTYEKATGEIPPSYETFLQVLQEKRKSIFQCDTLMNEPDKDSDAPSFSASNSLRSQRNHHRRDRGSSIIYTISHNNP